MVVRVFIYCSVLWYIYGCLIFWLIHYCVCIDIAIPIGRQGAPKQRVLHCAPDATLLYWGDKSAYKSVFLDEVREIRLGTDIDPVATPAHLNPSRPPPSISDQRAKRTNSGRLLKTNSTSKMDTMESGSGKGSVHYGTETLRRTCKKEDMSLSLSLILPSRFVVSFILLLLLLLVQLCIQYLWKILTVSSSITEHSISNAKLSRISIDCSQHCVACVPLPCLKRWDFLIVVPVNGTLLVQFTSVLYCMVPVYCTVWYHSELAVLGSAYLSGWWLE